MWIAKGLIVALRARVCLAALGRPFMFPTAAVLSWHKEQGRQRCRACRMLPESLQSE